jgi:hypothetical protein
MSILWYMGMSISERAPLALVPGIPCLLLFLYWTFLEGYRPVPGENVLGIAVVGSVGERIGFRTRL